ncbi:MAG: hypothetical protein ABL977_04380 [Candidatus Eisenbacteria bacterium]
MSGHNGFRALDALVARVLSARVKALEAAAKAKPSAATLRASAHEKLAQGANLTRPEAGAYLGVSTKKIQRMDDAGTLPRCPGFGSSVLYSARDVLRLASASAPKGA